MDLEGKTALITGGSTGIGRAVALKLASLKVNIAINYSSSKEEAVKTLEDVKKFGGNARIYQADVSNCSQVEEMCKAVIQDFGKLDILINNAGATNYVALNDLDGLLDEYWDRAFNVNVKGAFYTSRSCMLELKKNTGCIVNITSIAGFSGKGSSIAYAASKAAGISLTKSLAHVLAPEVKVNSIAPGIVLTRWVEGQEDHIRRQSEGTLLGRVATPEDVANMTVAIIQGGDFVTGQTLVVDGGCTL
ncbi:SDR family oxidoreductase [Neobacillus vireti]|uniref:SDR family NAD(P)-dependent oxidoreductase n=1 Tax=Neobacillus vireti TaxID=220686 RepID=UPI002FFFD008